MTTHHTLTDVDPNIIVSPVTQITKEVLQGIKKLVDNMEYFKLRYLTSPDVGLPVQVMVAYVPQNPDTAIVMINPTIAYTDDDGIIVEFNDISGRPQSVILLNSDDTTDIANAINELTSKVVPE
jgi:peptide deformylase